MSLGVESGTYPMIAVIANGHWIPGDAESNASVLRQLTDMIGPSILGECFQQGQHIKALMMDQAEWTVTRDRSKIDEVHLIHDCDECRASRETAVQHMLTHEDSYLAVAVVNYTAVLA